MSNVVDTTVIRQQLSPAALSELLGKCKRMADVPEHQWAEALMVLLRAVADLLQNRPLLIWGFHRTVYGELLSH